MTLARWREAVKMTSPVFFGYIAIGIPFGLMCVKAGYPVWMSPVMSIIMFAGAGQYVAMGLFASGASLASVAITQALVNSRHVVYGLSLIDRFKQAGKCRPYLIFALTDETYSLLTSCRDRDQMPGEKPGEFCFAVAMLDHIYWILGGVIGAVAGTLIPFSMEGVDFALTALFAVLLIEQIKKGLSGFDTILSKEVAQGAAKSLNHRALGAQSGETQPMAPVAPGRAHCHWLASRRSPLLPPLIGICTTAAAIAASRLGVLSSGNILITSMVAGIVLLMVFCHRPPRGGKEHSTVQPEGAAARLPNAAQGGNQ